MNPENLMFLGAVVCGLVSVYMIYEITVTGDPSQEWIIWVSVVVGFILFGGSFLSDLNKKPDTSTVPNKSKGITWES